MSKGKKEKRIIAIPATTDKIIQKILNFCEYIKTIVALANKKIKVYIQNMENRSGVSGAVEQGVQVQERPGNLLTDNELQEFYKGSARISTPITLGLWSGTVLTLGAGLLDPGITANFGILLLTESAVGSIVGLGAGAVQVLRDKLPYLRKLRFQGFSDENSVRISGEVRK